MSKKTRLVLKPSIKKKLVAICILLCMIAVVGTSLAFLMSSSSPVTNKFNPAHVDSHVNDDYTVTNKGDVPAYLRASVTFNWVVDDSEASNNTVYYVEGSTLPQIKTTGEGWTKKGDYYYYESPVDPETASAAPVWTELTDYITPDGYKLEIVVISDAIQADGTTGTWAD